MPKNNLPTRKNQHALIRKEKDETPFFKKAISSALISSMATILSSLFLLSILSIFALKSPDPLSIIPIFGLISIMPSMFIGGYICSKIVKKSPVVCGIASGATTTAMTSILSLILTGIPSSGYGFFILITLHASAILFSVLGALTGNLKSKKSKRRFG